MNIQRYKVSDMAHLHPDRDGVWCKVAEAEALVQSHVDVNKFKQKIIAEQAKEIENLKGQNKTLDLGFDKSLRINSNQAKEINELKETLRLLKSPANAKRLNKALKGIDGGDVIKKELT